jgi:hypothetical protein
MNPLIKSILIGIVRHSLTALATFLTANGIIKADQAGSFVTPEVVLGVVTGLGVFGSMIYGKFKERQEKLTALAMPKGTTERELTMAVKNGEAASVTTHQDLPPVIMSK